MKKAALRRVIIYVLVFSLTFTSVSAAIARPVEVQAVVGVDDAALAILLALLAAGGYYATSSAAAANVKSGFLSYVNNFSNSDINSSEPTTDVIKSTDVYTGFINLGYSSAQAFEASKHFLSALSLIEFGYTDESERSWSVSVDGSNYTISDTVGNISWTCTVPNFKVKSVISNGLEIKLFISEKELSADDENVKSFVVGLLAQLKVLVDGFLKTMTSVFAQNVAFVKSNTLGQAETADPVFSSTDSLQQKLSTQLLLLSHNFYQVYGINDFATTAAASLSSIPDGYIQSSFMMRKYTLPSSYLMTIRCFLTRDAISIAFTEDLGDFSLVNVDGCLKKVDPSGNFSSVANYFVCGFSSSGPSFFGTKDSDFSFMSIPFEDYIDWSDKAYFYYVVDYDLSNYYSSVENYEAGVSYLVEAKDYLLYGSSDYAAEADSDVYVPDSITYNDIIGAIDDSSSDNLDAALDTAKKENSKALEDAKDSTASGDSDVNDSDLSILDRILKAIINVNSTISTHLPLDVSSVINSFAGTADVISDIDKLLNQKLPVIGDMADVITGSLPAINDIKDWLEKQAAPSIDSIAQSGVKALVSIDNLGDRIVDAVAPISLLRDIDATADSISNDNAKLLENIENVISGDRSISVSIAPTVQEPTDQDDFNLGIFNLLYLLFLILFKIIMIFCHCLELLFTIHSVEAYPYFINLDMTRGLNWIKSVQITGGLLNISLYDFLFALVRIVLVFSIVRLIKHYTDRLS